MHLFWITAYFAIGWVIRVGMIPVVLRRYFTPGASIAWLGIVFLHPYIGFALYMLVGESRLGPGRVARHTELVAHYRGEATAVPDPKCICDPPLDDYCRPIALQAHKISRMPVVSGNCGQLIADAGQMVDRLVADIDAATSQVHLLYYIVADDATGRRVTAALAAAAQRGVRCRLLADAFASRGIFHHDGLAERLRRQGVEVAAALPSSPLRRRDLRNHRKLAVIDDRIAFVGSQNLIDPDYGGRHGAPWYDLTGRITGPVVRQFAIVFAEDWAFETGQMLDVPPPERFTSEPGGAAMQVVPTGPVFRSESFRRVVLGAIQSARRRLVLTTPYFVPDEPTLVALMMAADRGVEVSLLLPAVPDHLFTAAAGRAHFAALLEAGVGIFLYRPGLLHAKSISVDDAVAVFGSANLDVRSFNLNFEVSLLMYGPAATSQLYAIHARYLADCQRLDPAEWAARRIVRQYADSAVSLISPLL
jgi:cardiolipin synthase